MFIHYLFLCTYVFISATCVTISSVTTRVCLVQLCWAAIFPDPLLSRYDHLQPTTITVTSPLAHCRCAHVVHGPLPSLPSRSHHPRPNAVALTLFTAPRHHCHSGHITPGPTPLPSHCSWPPAVVAIVVTSPPATAVALTLVVNGPLPLSPLQSHHSQPNQRCCRLTSFTAPCCCCRRGHITPGPPPLRSRG